MSPAPPSSSTASSRKASFSSALPSSTPKTGGWTEETRQCITGVGLEHPEAIYVRMGLEWRDPAEGHATETFDYNVRILRVHDQCREAGLHPRPLGWARQTLPSHRQRHRRPPLRGRGSLRTPRPLGTAVPSHLGLHPPSGHHHRKHRVPLHRTGDQPLDLGPRHRMGPSAACPTSPSFASPSSPRTTQTTSHSSPPAWTTWQPWTPTNSSPSPTPAPPNTPA